MIKPDNPTCPFCGGHAVLSSFEGKQHTITTATLVCYHCHTEMTISTERWWDLPRLEDDLDALEHWSRRPQ